jgi:hypothetical protein
MLDMEEQEVEMLALAVQVQEHILAVAVAERVLQELAELAEMV